LKEFLQIKTRGGGGGGGRRRRRRRRSFDYFNSFIFC
jgi:hypothetical protein